MEVSAYFSCIKKVLPHARWMSGRLDNVLMALKVTSSATCSSLENRSSIWCC